MKNNILEENEEIIYTSKANPGRTSTQIFRFVLVGIVLAIFYYLLFFSYNKTDLFNWTIFLIVLFLISILTIYGIIYNILLKHRAKNELYYITDKRIILINQNKVLFNDIDKVGVIGISREKDNFGDITFHFNVNMDNPLDNVIKSIKESKNITFSGIKNPREVVEIVKKNNKDVYIYDDRPTILSKKM